MQDGQIKRKEREKKGNVLQQINTLHVSHTKIIK